MSALQLALGLNWAMAPEAVQTVLEVASREGEYRRFVYDGKLDKEAVAALTGKRLKGTEGVTYRVAEDGGKVAVIDLIGPLFRRANMFTEMSGATSYELFARDYHAAQSDESVKSIAVNIDSGGGEANGAHETARMIYASRGNKPVVAYVGGLGASAAYFIAAAADVVVLDAMAEVGSIGVVTKARKNEDDGTITFTSTQSPYKRVDASSKAGGAKIQAEIDAMAQVFVESVAEFRGVPVESVLNDFGKGGVLLGRAAVKAGMADTVGSFEGVIAALASGNVASLKPSASTEAKPKGKTTMSWDEIKAAFKGASTEEKVELGLAAPEPEPAALGDNSRFVELQAEVESLRAAKAESDAAAEAARAQSIASALASLETEAFAFTLEAVRKGAINPPQADSCTANYLNAASAGEANLEVFKGFITGMAKEENGVVALQPGASLVADVAEPDKDLALFAIPSQSVSAEAGEFDVDSFVNQANAERGHKSGA